MNLAAKRPLYSVLQSEKGIQLPSLDNALERYFEAIADVYLTDKIAV
jgi:dTDP-4-dehydrorhamnose reductase